MGRASHFSRLRFDAVSTFLRFWLTHHVQVLASYCLVPPAALAAEAKTIPAATMGSSHAVAVATLEQGPSDSHSYSAVGSITTASAPGASSQLRSLLLSPASNRSGSVDASQSPYSPFPFLVPALGPSSAPAAGSALPTAGRLQTQSAGSAGSLSSTLSSPSLLASPSPSQSESVTLAPADGGSSVNSMGAAAGAGAGVSVGPEVTDVSVAAAQILRRNHVVYQINVENSRKRKTYARWTVMKRFGEFAKLNEKLRAGLEKEGKQVRLFGPLLFPQTPNSSSRTQSSLVHLVACRRR